MTARETMLERASRTTFDVAVIGGGINGASLHRRLGDAGYDAVVLDRGDFACGTSQASGMMIWGGLLYLRNLDLPAVLHFSRAQDRMVHGQPEAVSRLTLRFVPAPSGRLGRLPAMAALHLYWLLGRGRRRRPRTQAAYDEIARLARPGAALCFEEAMIRQSDSRFVLRWLAPGARRAGTAALNYAEVRGGAWCAAERRWRLEVRDTLTGREIEVRARAVANCAGVWTDRVNARFGVRSPWRHAFSKGVYLVFERFPEQRAGLVLEMGVEDDVVTSIPWGPVELWGPTETSIRDPEEGLRASPEDVSFLLDLRSRRLRDPGSKDAIVALRCGVRPLAVPAGHRDGGYPLDLSRRPRVAADDERPWVSVYGGKLTGCAETADRAIRRLRRYLPPPGATGHRGGEGARPGPGHRGGELARSDADHRNPGGSPRQRGAQDPSWTAVGYGDGGDGDAAAAPPGAGAPASDHPARPAWGSTAFPSETAFRPETALSPESASTPETTFPLEAAFPTEAAFPPELEEGMPAPAWSRDHEFACTLEDYLRRRTNIAQWVPRGGLGRRDEHVERLRRLSLELMGGDSARAETELDRYRRRVAEELDQVLDRV